MPQQNLDTSQWLLDNMPETGDGKGPKKEHDENSGKMHNDACAAAASLARAALAAFCNSCSLCL